MPADLTTQRPAASSDAPERESEPQAEPQSEPQSQLPSQQAPSHEHREALADLMRLANGCAPGRDLLLALLERLTRVSWLTPNPRAAVFIADAGARELQMAACLDLRLEIETLCARVPFGDCLCGRVAETGHALHTGHVDHLHGRGYPGMADHGHDCLPLTVAGTLRGVLMLYREADAKRHAEEQPFLTLVAEVFAGVLARMDAAARLGETASRLRQAQAMAHMGDWWVDIGAGLLHASPEMRAVTGIEREHVRLGDFFEAIHPGDRAGVELAWMDGLEVGRWDRHFRLTFRGRCRWMHCAGVFERGEDGRPVRARGMIQDVTESEERRIALERQGHDLSRLVSERNAELVANETRWNLALQASDLGVWDWDVPSGRIFFSPIWKSMLGLAEHEVGDGLEEWSSRVHPDDLPLCEAALTRHLNGDADTYRCEHRLRAADGSWRWVQDLGRVVTRDDAGNPLRIVGTHLDITERKQAEQALREARAVAAAASQAKSTFLAKVSHELRTPLHAILGLAQLGARRAADGPLEQDFAHIEQAGRHLLGLVNDVLDLTRIESGTLQPERKPLDLPATLDSALAMVRAAALDKGLELASALDPGLPRWVRGDTQRLTQVLIALLDNAVRFTERGRVGLSAEPTHNGVRIRIGDTGPGLSPAQLARVYEPFNQGDDSSSRRHGGAGLGLTLARELAVLMGGELAMESKPGVGTLMTLDLPLAACTPPRTQPRPPADQQRLDGLRVLAAEDNAVNQLVLESVLVDQGARLTLADNGARAVERVRAEGPKSFDLVLMDVQMPVMDGYEATRQIRALAPGLPILGLTANAGEDERARCLAAGMLGHITKPFDIDTLVTAAIAAVVRTAPAADAAQQPAENTHMEPLLANPTHPKDEIDWQALEARFPGRDDFVTRLLDAFLNANSGHPDALREAAGRGDLGTVRFIAHAVKGSAGNVQAGVLSELAARTETAARDGDPVGGVLAGTLADRLQVLLRFLAERREETEVQR